MAQRQHDGHHVDVVQRVFVLQADGCGDAEHKHARACHVGDGVAEENRSETCVDRVVEKKTY